MTNKCPIVYLTNNRLIADSTQNHLESIGYSILSSCSVKSYSDTLSTVPFDLFILDLPYTESLAAIKELSTLQPNIPIIIILSENPVALISSAVELGCSYFVPRTGNEYLYLLAQSIKNALSTIQCNDALNITKKVAERVQSIAKVGNWQYYPGSDVAEWSQQEFFNFGFTPDSVSPTYEKYINVIHPDDKALVEQFNIDCLVNHVPTEFVFRLLLDDGEIRYIRAITEVDTNDKNNVIRVFGVSQDITDQKRVEARLNQAATVYETTTEAIFITDDHNVIISINAAFTRITGFTKQQAIGKTPNIMASGYHDALFFHAFWQALKQQGSWQGEIWNRHADGHIFPTWQSITAIKDPQDNIIQYVSIFNDMSTRKANEELIRYQATYDALTDLPNRNLFHDRMGLAIKQARRTKRPIALMLMDLDRFKWVNDTLGHKAGDTVLTDVASRLKKAIRSSDTVARLGGDEFVIILPELSKKSDVKTVVEKIFSSFSTPIDIDGNEIFISASFGISLYPADGSDIETIQKNADSAMYAAKEAGRNRYHYFTPQLQAESDRRLSLINHMRKAIERKEFSIVYQPIMDISLNTIASAEALIRWHHHELGWVSPAEFIPLAEESGLIRAIGDWVVNQVAKDMQHWHKSGLKPIHISINQSPAQFSLGACDQEWKAIFAEHGIPLSQVTIEITETVFMEKGQQCIDILSKMQAMGIQISLDDFGTGYSSLSYLKRFPVDILKIDREFIKDLTIDPSDALLVETILTLAEKMKIKVIAEGVETQEQLAFLKQHHCRYVQGYLFSKPLTIGAFETYLQSH